MGKREMVNPKSSYTVRNFPAAGLCGTSCCVSVLFQRGRFTRNLSSCLSGSAEVSLQDIHSSECLSSVVSMIKCHEKGIFKSVGVLMVSHIVFLKVGCFSDRILRYICAGPKPSQAP